MREIRTSGSEGGGLELNRSSLPLSKTALRLRSLLRSGKCLILALPHNKGELL